MKIYPIKTYETLTEIVNGIRDADKKGPDRWIHPAIIIRSDSKLELLEDFSESQFINISKRCEEFYSILIDDARTNALKRYLRRVCNENDIGIFNESDVVIAPSQINKEFIEYLLINQSEIPLAE